MSNWTRRSWTGATGAAGAVAGLRTTRAPISAARAVMEHSPHVLMTYEGADEFACEHGLEQVDNRWFVTPERRRQLDELLAAGGAFDADIKYGTIGAVAVDVNGHVAAATSTGGLTAKRWGRIGDSPLIGAGTYADDRAAAVSATGLGEVFIRAAAAHELCARVRIGGEALQEALDGVLAEMSGAGRQRRADRGRAVGRGGLGLHHAGHVSRHGRAGRARRSRSTTRNRSDRAAPRAPIRVPAAIAFALAAPGSRRPRGGSRDRAGNGPSGVTTGS